MFSLGFVALMALVLFIQIAVFTWAWAAKDVNFLLTSPLSWVLYFVMLCLGSLGAIGLDVWDDAKGGRNGK